MKTRCVQQKPTEPCLFSFQCTVDTRSSFKLSRHLLESSRRRRARVRERKDFTILKISRSSSRRTAIYVSASSRVSQCCFFVFRSKSTSADYSSIEMSKSICIHIDACDYDCIRRAYRVNNGFFSFDSKLLLSTPNQCCDSAEKEKRSQVLFVL